MSYKNFVFALVATVAIPFVGWSGETSSVLFHVGFDSYSVRADAAGGSPESPDLTEGLMLRMREGRGQKGNALYLNGGEKVRYQGSGNICPQRGTISFWVAPMGWKASVKDPRPFVSFKMPRFRLTVGKIYAPTGFGIECAWDDAPTVSKSERACTLITDAAWADGRWHRFDAAWSEKGIKFFVDGVANPARDIHGYLRTFSEVAFARRWTGLPLKAPEGSTITLGGMKKGESTAFDEIEIRDYPMTEVEARAEYVKWYPLAQGVPPVKPPRPPRTFDETPYKAKVGIDRTVPEPWTPIRRLGDRSFGVLMREYTFDKGPFPSQVRVEDEDVLTMPPVLGLKTTAGADPVAWSPVEVAEAREDKVALKGEGTGNGLDFSWKGELWFDGAYIVEVSAEPTGGGIGAFVEHALPIEKMDLSYVIPAAFSKYLLTNRTGPNGNVSVCWTNSYDREFYTYPYRAETLLWLTGARKGFLWWTDSDANCVHRPGSKPVHLRRTANGDCAVRINYVNTPATLTKKATWRIVFQATPTRVPPKDYRRFYSGDNCFTPHQNVFVFSWSTWHDWLSGQDQTHCASHWPRDFEAYGKELSMLHKHNAMRLLPYNMPGVLGDNEPEWDTKLEEWQRIPSRWAEGGKKGGVHWKTRQCCGNTGIADRDAWRLDRVLTQFATNGQAGVYYDLCDPESCENDQHGCGGTDAFGRAYKSNIALHLRDYLMRIYKVAHRHGGMVFNHAHNYFNPVCHGFSDYWFPGEQHHGGVGRNPLRFYTDDLTPYELECAWNPEIKGVGISQLGRHEGAKLNKRGLANPEYTVRAIAPFLVHDVMPSHGKLDGMTVDRWWGVCEEVNLSAADFRGYWQPGPALSTNPKVMASIYTWKKPSPYCAMLVACNYDRQDACGLKLPDGVSPDTPCRDLWNGRDILAKDVSKLMIPPGAFAVVGIKGRVAVRPRIILDSSRLDFVTFTEAKVEKLNSGWQKDGNAFVRPFNRVPTGIVRYGAVFAFPSNVTAVLKFLDARGGPLKTEKVRGGAPVTIRGTFDQPGTLASVRLEPSAPVAPEGVFVKPFRVTVGWAVDEDFTYVDRDGAHCSSDSLRELGSASADTGDRALPCGWHGREAKVISLPYSGCLTKDGKKGFDRPCSDAVLEIAAGGCVTPEADSALLTDRYAFEFDALVEETSDIRAAGVRLGDLYAFTPGIWYHFRFEVSGKAARVKLNGRTIAADVAVSGLSIENTAPVRLLVDDMKAFALESPADYPPVPVRPKGEEKWDVMINVCPLWYNGYHAGWGCIERGHGPKPVLGYYDEGLPETADWEIKYMVEHGVDVQAFCWYPESHDGPIRHPRYDMHLRDGFKNARYSEAMKYCLIWEIQNAGRPHSLAAWKKNYVPYLIEHHFKDPRYYVVDGRPVLIVFGGWNFPDATSFGSTEATRAAFDYLGDELKKLGFKGVLPIYSHGDSHKPFVAECGFEAAAPYNYGIDGWKVETQKLRNRARANDSVVFEIPAVSVGFNSEPWHGEPHPMMSPADFETSLKWVRDEFMPGQKHANGWQSRVVLLSTWNEYGEGTYLMPTEEARGFGCLDAVRRVFTDASPDSAANLRPTAVQRRRICNLYPQDFSDDDER